MTKIVISIFISILSMASFIGCGSMRWSNTLYESHISLRIDQMVLDYKRQWFIVTGDYLYIKEGKIDRSGTYKMRIKYRKKLNSEELKEIKELAHDIVTLEKDSFSNLKVFGSAHWKVSIILNGQIKEVYLSNTIPSETYDLFEYVNSLIPRNKKRLYHKEFLN